MCASSRATAAEPNWRIMATLLASPTLSGEIPPMDSLPMSAKRAPLAKRSRKARHQGPNRRGALQFKRFATSLKAPSGLRTISLSRLITIMYIDMFVGETTGSTICTSSWRQLVDVTHSHQKRHCPHLPPSEARTMTPLAHRTQNHRLTLSTQQPAEVWALAWLRVRRQALLFNFDCGQVTRSLCGNSSLCNGISVKIGSAWQAPEGAT